MKVSVSIPDEDVEFLDAETGRGVYASRSAALHAAVRLLRERELTDAYGEAFREVDRAWDGAIADGLAE